MTSGGSGREVFPGASSKSGVFQGYIISPVTFMLYGNDLPDVICNIDIYLLPTSRVDTADWGRKRHANFNAAKTSLVSINWYNKSGTIDVKMDVSILEEKSSLKMLGPSFSSKFDWDSYTSSC